MTTPTQAQIEAALDAERDNIIAVIRSTTWSGSEEIVAMIRNRASAAQVGEQDECSEVPDAYTKDFYGNRRVTLTYQEYDLLTLKKEQIEAATIERCAQVADELAKGYGGHTAIILRNAAAAIRKAAHDQPKENYDAG